MIWTSNLESQIFSIVKYKSQAEIKEKYPNAFFTTSDEIITTPKFPTIYIHELNGSETGQTTEGTEIDAVDYSMQIEVSMNTKKSDVKAIMDILLEQFKSLSFSVVSIPPITSASGVFRGICRVRRTIGGEDMI